MRRNGMLLYLGINTDDFLVSMVCLEDYDPDKNLMYLSCRRVFHRDCVGQ